MKEATSGDKKTIFQILGGEVGLTVVKGCYFCRDILGMSVRMDQFTATEAMNGYAVRGCRKWSGYEGDVYININIDENSGRIIAQCQTSGCKHSSGYTGKR